MASQEIYDLLIVFDATYSMSHYLKSLQVSLPQIISVSALTNCFSRIGFIAYHDYQCRGEVVEWSGWLDQATKARGEAQPDLVEKVEQVRLDGSYDWPEATKTGLAKAWEVMREEAKTVIILYTDAAPHTLGNADNRDSCNYGREQKALKKIGPLAKPFKDWVDACNIFQQAKKAEFYCILEPGIRLENSCYYHYLSTITGGASFTLTKSQPSDISQTTVGILLAWMGVEKAGATNVEPLRAFRSTYKNLDGIADLKNERDPRADKYFLIPEKGTDKIQMQKTVLSSDLLKQTLPKKKTPVQDFAKRYAMDEDYKVLVVDHLKRIIHDSVTTMSLNPVLGSLWRAVCNDRTNDARDGLISDFGHQVEQISDPNEKARMKTWLEESYDYTAEVLEAIQSVPADESYPCVYLDPTLTFDRSTSVDDQAEDEDAGRPITAFKRDELLEIGRSCDYKILRRLGRVLTRLNYVTSAADIPEHIAKDESVARIPMALASQKYGRRFWRILLHIVVPGTMLSSRPGALLAALSVRIGVKPLMEPAYEELQRWRGMWNDVKIPENWNVSCLSLLLDADRIFRSEKKKIKDSIKGQSLNEQTVSLEDSSDRRVLNDADRELFDRLISYKLLERNLTTTLAAKVGWTPEKTTMPMGSVITCKSCNYSRSVTIMSKDNVCGICQLPHDFKTEEDRDTYINGRVSKEDNETTDIAWVECNVQTCRAQYVVYHTEALNVRPKCYYCRRNGEVGPAPTVECSKCLSRVIWPEEYRPADMSEFTCIGCTHGAKTIIEKETTATAISDENTKAWLIKNDYKIKFEFNNRSLFHTISQADPTDFCANVHFFPNIDNPLTVRGKLVRNPESLVSELQSWISRRQRQAGTCSLCFSDVRKEENRPACGRSGCQQLVCKDCLTGWYGLNSAGRIINTAALSCPFCRRAPTAKTLASYGMGVHALGDLKHAVEISGQWISAWCVTCGFAKPYIERVCAAGAPAQVKNWVCEDCHEQEEARRRALEAGKTVRSNNIKDCPGCGIPTQKTYGCDHMTCPVEDCKTHWCFFCGKGCTASTIYQHLSREHGGYYDGGADWDSDEDDDDYEVQDYFYD